MQTKHTPQSKESNQSQNAARLSRNLVGSFPARSLENTIVQLPTETRSGGSKAWSTVGSQKMQPGKDKGELNLDPFEGIWEGRYPYGLCLIKISKGDGGLVAVKASQTPPGTVPEGAITWIADPATGVGQGQSISGKTGTFHWEPGQLRIVSTRRLFFTWERGLDPNQATVEYVKLENN